MYLHEYSSISMIGIMKLHDWYNESWISTTELLSSIMIMGFVSIGTQYSCIVNQ